MLIDLGAGRNPHGRIDPGAGDTADRQRSPRRRRPCDKLAAVIGAVRQLHRSREGACVSRSLGRRPVRHARRDGVRRPCGISVNLDVLAVDPVAADSGDFKIRPEQIAVRRGELILRSAVQRRAGMPCCRCRHDDQRSVMERPARRRSRRAESHHRQAERGAMQSSSGATRSRLFAQPRAELQTHWSEVLVAHRAPARQPRVCRRGVRARDRCVRLRTCRINLTFDPADDVAAPFIASGVRPRVAILREQGVNSQIELAYAFDRAGFAAVDVHMTDLIEGRHSPRPIFKGFVACGGFSYGDVLGAGGGWAKTILHQSTRSRNSSRSFSVAPTRLRSGCATVAR